MSLIKKWTTSLIILSTVCLSTHHLEAITYVTDTGGYAYDESRAVTNLAPAVALATVAIVGIIAIGVQNTHRSSSSSCHYSSSYDCSGSSSSHSKSHNKSHHCHH